MRRTLTLRPAPAQLKPEPAPIVSDPVKIALAQMLGYRFICRKSRYILQARMVLFAPDVPLGEQEHTWVDIPLVPEVYG